MTANKRIALNVIASYGRSLYALLLGLFTARWALYALGQVDYGLYGVVGGLTVFISYFNTILGGAIGRFYAVSVGLQQTDPEGGLESCRKWFTTAVVLNTIVPVALILIGYPIGVWTIKNFLTIPADRIDACVWVWRFVCVTCLLGMMTLPLQAMYTAKQYIAELTVYSFVTTTLNAGFVYYMVRHPGVWLVKYAFWMCLMAVLPQLIIAVRAHFIFPECRVVRKYLHCWQEVKELCSFSLWNGVGALGGILRAQGNAILINKFFGPRVNAGFAIGSQVSGQTNMLSGSLIGAFSPAIYNAWGAKDYARAREMAYRACRLGTLFILVFAIPLILEVEEVLTLWLATPPPFAAEFCVYVMIMNIIDKTAVGQMICVNANGKIALYQAFLGTVVMMTLPLAWVLVLCGMGATSVGCAMVVTMAICALGRVVLARRLVGLSGRYWVKKILLPLAFVSGLTLGVGVCPTLYFAPSVGRVVGTVLLCEAVLLPAAWFVLLSEEERTFIRSRLRGRYAK